MGKTGKALGTEIHGSWENPSGKLWWFPIYNWRFDGKIIKPGASRAKSNETSMSNQKQIGL